MKRLGKWVLWGMIALGVGAGGYFANEWIHYEGRSELAKIAKAQGRCQLDDCSDGGRELAALVAVKMSLPIERVEWCLGVEKVSEVRVHRGGWLKSLLVDVLYMPCSRFSDEAK